MKYFRFKINTLRKLNWKHSIIDLHSSEVRWNNQKKTKKNKKLEIIFPAIYISLVSRESAVQGTVVSSVINQMRPLMGHKFIFANWNKLFLCTAVVQHFSSGHYSAFFKLYQILKQNMFCIALKVIVLSIIIWYISLFKGVIFKIDICRKYVVDITILLLLFCYPNEWWYDLSPIFFLQLSDSMKYSDTIICNCLIEKQRHSKCIVYWISNCCIQDRKMFLYLVPIFSNFILFRSSNAQKIVDYQLQRIHIINISIA